MLYHFVFFYFLIQIWFSYSFLIDSTGLTLAIFKIRNQIVSAVIIATDIKIPVQNQNPQLKNTVYICFHSCNTRYTNGKDRAAVTINKVIYKRANNQIICDIPAPFTLRIATSFCLRSVSRVMLEYTPNKVMMILTIAKNRIVSFSIYSIACISYRSS